MWNLTVRPNPTDRQLEVSDSELDSNYIFIKTPVQLAACHQQDDSVTAKV